jgi:hypothetical protein
LGEKGLETYQLVAGIKNMDVDTAEQTVLDGQEQPPVLLARKLMEEVEQKKVDARLLGGVAIYLRSPRVHIDPLARTYHDIDLAVSRRAKKALTEIMTSQGFVGDRHFNALHGHKRMVFQKDNVEVDIFIHLFEQCHNLDLEERITHDPLTLSLADLLLTKLQVVHINHKDLTDVLGLLLQYSPGTGEEHDIIDLNVIRSVTSQDWGWYTTVSDNLQKLVDLAQPLLSQSEVDLVKERVNLLRQAMEEAPKSLAWKLRSKVGRRLPWYVVPDEK